MKEACIYIDVIIKFDYTAVHATYYIVWEPTEQIRDVFVVLNIGVENAILR